VQLMALMGSIIPCSWAIMAITYCEYIPWIVMLSTNQDRRAPMFIELTAGICSGKAKGPCTGMTAAECPNGYTGLDTNTGPPVVCSGTGVGVSQSLHLSNSITLLIITGFNNILSLMDGTIHEQGVRICKGVYECEDGARACTILVVSPRSSVVIPYMQT
jgi:hypothetical protein